MDSIEELVRRYKKNGDMRAREELIDRCSYLIKYVLGKMSMVLPSILESDDLVSAGSIGLIDAIERFDVSRNVKFETYAYYRIRGSMLDELRAADTISRSAKEKINAMKSVCKDLENELGRGASDEEISKKLCISLEDYHDLVNKMNCVRLLSLDAVTDEDSDAEVRYYPLLNVLHDDSNPVNTLEQTELKDALKKAMDELDDKEKLAVTLYYYEDLTLKEIAHIMELSESRICQLHGRAVIKLRAKLKKADTLPLMRTLLQRAAAIRAKTKLSAKYNNIAS